MHPNSKPTPFPSTADLLALFNWLLNLTTRLLARSLNMPEPLVHHTGMFVYIRVQEVETSIGRRLCPVRLWRRIWALLRQHAPQDVVPPVELMPHDRHQVQKHNGIDDPGPFIVEHFARSRHRWILGQKTRPMEQAEPGQRIAPCRGEGVAGERHEQHHHIE